MNTRNSRQKSYLRAACCALTSAMLLLAGSFSASAFTSADAMTAYGAWMSTFSSTWGSVWWQGPEEIEMVEDGGNITDINTMCNGFISMRGSDWSGNPANDDCMWAVLAFIRAYNATGNTTYRTYAKNGFDMVYARAWDPVAGGLWWNTNDDYKASCINFPAAIAAHLLSVALNDSSYATKSQNIYNYGKSNLWNSANGQVADGKHSNGTTWTCYSYNLGTFMGAAYYNNDTSSATLSGNYAQTTWGVTMPVYATGGGNGGGFNGICLRWMGVAGYNTSYRQSVANNAWSKRNSSNLVNNQWDRVTPNTAQNDWDCSDIEVAMLTVTPDGAGGAVTNGTYKIVNRNSGLVADVKGTQTTNGTPVQQYAYNGGNNQRWTVTSLISGKYKIIGVQSGLALDVVGSGTANGTLIDIWPYGGAANQQWIATATSGGNYRLTPANAVGSALDVQHSATTNSVPLQIWTYSGGNSQQWSFQAP